MRQTPPPRAEREAKGRGRWNTRKPGGRQSNLTTSGSSSTIHDSHTASKSSFGVCDSMRSMINRPLFTIECPFTNPALTPGPGLTSTQDNINNSANHDDDGERRSWGRKKFPHRAMRRLHTIQCVHRNNVTGNPRRSLRGAKSKPFVGVGNYSKSHECYED